MPKRCRMLAYLKAVKVLELTLGCHIMIRVYFESCTSIEINSRLPYYD